jgi:hypothetical protein
MPIGRARHEPDPRETTRFELIRDLNTAQGEALDDAVLRGGEWVRKRPFDVEVAEALDRAERRLT